MFPKNEAEIRWKRPFLNRWNPIFSFFQRKWQKKLSNIFDVNAKVSDGKKLVDEKEKEKVSEFLFFDEVGTNL